MSRELLKRTIEDIKNFINLEKESGMDEFMLKSILSHKPSGQPAGYSHSPDKKINLENLEKRVRECKECPLCESRRNTVFGEGKADADLMFVGEAPGLEEDIQGRPFVGKAGSLLTKIIEAMGLKREDVYIANCLKCRPPQNRSPLPSEVVACREFLLEQIRTIMPKAICCLGKFAAQTLLMTEEPITSLRGRFCDLEGINPVRNSTTSASTDISNRVKVMPTFHPAYLLRNPKDKRLVWQDMKKLLSYLKHLQT
jgi:DNA polymerase